MEDRDDYPIIPQTEGSEEANACPVLHGYWCFDRACGMDHKTQCMMINPRDKIYVDGGNGDYIQQNIAFRREMEMNYAKTLEELASLKEENAKLRNKTINEAIAAILSSEHTKSLAIMRAVNDIIKKVEALKSS